MLLLILSTLLINDLSAYHPLKVAPLQLGVGRLAKPIPQVNSCEVGLTEPGPTL